MKQLKLASLFLAGAVGLTACAESAPPTAPMDGPLLSTTQATGRHMVQFDGTSVPSDFGDRVAALGGSVEVAYEGIGVAVVNGLDDSAAAALATASDVVAVDPDVELQFLDPDSAEVELASDAPASQTDPTTAFFYPRQWHLRQIGAHHAWAAGKLGSGSVTVAILDTGIDYTYPDLQGLVDLSRSRSFVPSDNALIAANFPGAHEVADLHYHGTHVAATVSSKALVAAGVTSRTTLMGVKVLSAAGRGTTSGVLAGIRYAADAGADVINMSLGGTFEKKNAPGFVSIIHRAITYAHQQGVVVVVSAGNSAIDLDHDGNGYKTYCSSPTVMCTSATGPTASESVNGPWTDLDALAYYSNFGRSSISVAAPGGNRGGAVAAGCSKFSLRFTVCQSPTRHYILNARGTSMASPHVSGLAALVVAEIGTDKPAQVIERIKQSADDLGEVGVDPAYGRGRINVVRALGLN